MACLCCLGRCRRGPPIKRSYSWGKVISWSMLDFSNSVVLMILLFQYTTFVSEHIYPNPKLGSDNFMYANIVVSILTIIISPPIGVLIDKYFIRVPILAVSITLYSVASMALYAVKQGDLVLPIAMYAVGMLFFRLNEMVTGAFLPSLCNDRDMTFISSFGYVVGFISGIIIILLSKLFTTPPADVVDKKQYLVSGYATLVLICGIVQLLSGLPPMLMLDNGIPEGEKRPKFTRRTIPESFRENGRTIKNSFKISKNLTLILLCYIFVSIGVQTIMSFGQMAIMRYGSKYGYTMADVQNLGLFFNAGMGVGCLVYGGLSKIITTYALGVFTLSISTLSFIVSFFWDKIPQTPSYNPALCLAWTIYGFATIGLGPAQALIRGSIGIFCEDEKKGEVFGCLESMIIFGGLIGSTIPGVIINFGIPAIFGWTMASFVIATIMWICIPMRKEEKQLRAKMNQTMIRGEVEATVIEKGDIEVNSPIDLREIDVVESISNSLTPTSGSDCTSSY